MKDLYIDLHLGLGDAIVLNGLIRYFSKYHKEVVFPCYPRNIESVEQMFWDVENITPVSNEHFDTIFADRPGVLKLGDRGKDFRNYKDYATGFYSQAHLGYDISYEEFKMAPWKGDDWGFSSPLVFIHDDLARGFKIDRGYCMYDDYTDWVSPEDFPQKSLASWLPVLEQAEEIHCIDSVFLHLADRVPTNGALFLHRYARPETKTTFDLPPLKKKWKIID